jgi:hypothetical protein
MDDLEKIVDEPAALTTSHNMARLKDLDARIWAEDLPHHESDVKLYTADQLHSAYRAGMMRAAEIAETMQADPGDDENPGDDTWLARTSSNGAAALLATAIRAEAATVKGGENG